MLDNPLADVFLPEIGFDPASPMGFAAINWVPMCIGISAPPRFVLVFGKRELARHGRVCEFELGLFFLIRRSGVLG